MGELLGCFQWIGGGASDFDSACFFEKACKALDGEDLIIQKKRPHWRLHDAI